MRFTTNPTEQDYYERITWLLAEDQDHGTLTDVVQSSDEWALAKAALMQFIAEQDTAWIESDAMTAAEAAEDDA